MKFHFNDQIWLVTGASRGIGLAIARTAAEAGATVALHFNQDRSAAASALQSLKPGKHACFQADLGRDSDSEALIHEVLSQYGKLHVLVNNAGIYHLHPFQSTDFETWKKDWHNTININLNGPAHLSFLAAKQMQKDGGCKIINVSSRGAYRGEPTAPAYGAAKAGLNALTQSLAQALAPYNILVYGVAPGFVRTDMTEAILDGPDGESIKAQSPLNRVAEVNEIASTVCFLASDNTDSLTGAIIDVNGASYLR